MLTHVCVILIDFQAHRDAFIQNTPCYDPNTPGYDPNTPGYDPNTPGLSKHKNHAASETQTYRRYVE